MKKIKFVDWFVKHWSKPATVLRKRVMGREALHQYRLAPADMVIMDILMPNQDGLENTVALRRELPDVKVHGDHRRRWVHTARFKSPLR